MGEKLDFELIGGSMEQSLGFKLERKEIELTSIFYERHGKFDPYGDLFNEIIPDGLPAVLVFSEEASEREKPGSFERLRLRHERALDGELKGFPIVVGDNNWLGTVFLNKKREILLQLKNMQAIKFNPENQRVGLFVYTGKEARNSSREFWAESFIIDIEGKEIEDVKKIEPEKTEVNLNSEEANNSRRIWNENEFGFFDELKKSLKTDSEGNMKREVDFGLGITGLAQVVETKFNQSVILTLNGADISEFIRSKGETLKPIEKDNPFSEDKLMVKWFRGGYNYGSKVELIVKRLFKDNRGASGFRIVKEVTGENLARLTGAMEIVVQEGHKPKETIVVYVSEDRSRPKNPYKDKPGGRKRGGVKKGGRSSYHR